jgi:hypothetical protein
MKRFVQLVSVLLVSASIGGCVSAKQRAQEQQELERSIRKTSDPDVVKDCAFIMDLRPDGLHHTPEAQAASLVIPKQGVSWVVFGGSGSYQLYSCKAPQNEQLAKAPVPTPVETKPETRMSAPVEAKPEPAPSEAKPEVVAKEPPEAEIEAPAPPRESASKTRVTNNPEAVKGCRFLASFAEYQKVSHFQEDVVRAGGNLGYIVATNQNGDVIGESYLCPDEPKQ